MAQDTTQAELQQIFAKLDGIERADAPWASCEQRRRDGPEPRQCPESWRWRRV